MEKEGEETTWSYSATMLTRPETPPAIASCQDQSDEDVIAERTVIRVKDQRRKSTGRKQSGVRWQ